MLLMGESWTAMLGAAKPTTTPTTIATKIQPVSESLFKWVSCVDSGTVTRYRAANGEIQFYQVYRALRRGVGRFGDARVGLVVDW